MTLAGQKRWLKGRVAVVVLEEWPDGMCVVSGGLPATFRGWVHKRDLSAARIPGTGVLAVEMEHR